MIRTMWTDPVLRHYVLGCALAAAIVAGYALALWRLLRAESAATIRALAALCVLAAALRLLYPRDFPNGLNEDEMKFFVAFTGALRSGQFSGESFGLAFFPNGLFQAVLAPLFGPSAFRWPIRLYSIVTGILATPAAFAVLRGMGVPTAGSLAGGGLFAVLPWALFFGRIELGGELTFHQLLLLAALARLIWAEGGWAEVGIGSLGLCLLLYDYPCGRSMIGMLPVAAVLARGWRRLACLLIGPIAFAGFLPFFLPAVTQGSPYVSRGLMRLADPTVSALPPHLMVRRTMEALKVLVAPVAANDVFTANFAGVHPLWVLALAAVGVLTGVRRGLFLGIGFAGGMAPVVLSGTPFPSVHRMQMAFAFLSLSAGAAVGILGDRPRARAVALAILLAATVQSVAFYFSAHTWAAWASTPAAQLAAAHTALAENVPGPPYARIIVDANAQQALGPRQALGESHEPLRVENWMPPDDPVVYAFTGPAMTELRPFYEEVFGAQSVRAFGGDFLLLLERGDRGWVRRHGWAHGARCGDLERQGQVPVLFHVGGLTFADVARRCQTAVTADWRGRWVGPEAQLLFRTSGASRIVTTTGGVAADGSSGVFRVRPGTEIAITVVFPTGWTGDARLFEMMPRGRRVPAWENVVPVWPADPNVLEEPSG